MSAYESQFRESLAYGFQVDRKFSPLTFGETQDHESPFSQRVSPRAQSFGMAYYLCEGGDKALAAYIQAARDEAAKSGRLFEDLVFPADDSSLFPSSSSLKRIVWKRPHELVANPRFFVNGASRFDVKQGELGDCWLLAAVSNLTLHPKLFDNIVLPGQSFSMDYCGLFRFRFWWFGEWVNVVIDDRLPTINGSLVFMSSADGNEFWSALLEKAYAKLHGSYEALSGGRASNAMDDFTGGVSEQFDLDQSVPDLFDIILKGFERGSLIAASTEPNPLIYQERCSNGIIKGHAYSITNVTQCPIRNYRGLGGKANLIRVRNPWGNEAEWNGPWGDKSPLWNYVSKAERRQLGLVFEHDGEFWMEFKDFIANFNSVEMTSVHLGSLTEKKLNLHVKHLWEVKSFKGSWAKSTTAGGCRNFPSTFWNNPNFFVTLKEEDDGDKDAKCTMIVALLQKPPQRRSGRDRLLTIGFSVFPVPQTITREGTLNISALKSLPEVRGMSSYVNLRQICHRFCLPPGTYCIIPTTYRPDEESDFLLRLFCEKPYSAKTKENALGFSVLDQKAPQNLPFFTADVEAKLRDLFRNLAGPDGEVDCKELQNLLHKRFASDFAIEGFSRTTCRSLIAMMDSQTGKLGREAFVHLWNIICIWKKTFEKHDRDSSRSLTGGEFREALINSGFQVTNRLFTTLMSIYGDEMKEVHFDDFVLCAVRMSKATKIFREKDKMNTNSATFSLNEFMEQAMCI